MSLGERFFGSKTERDADTQSPSEISLDLSLTEAFNLLRNERRQLILTYLHEEAGTQGVDLRELSTVVASRQLGKPEPMISEGERKRVYVALYQCHLPKLDERGVVKFDKKRSHVYPAGGTADAAAFLDVAETMRADENTGQTDERDE